MTEFPINAASNPRFDPEQRSVSPSTSPLARLLLGAGVLIPLVTLAFMIQGLSAWQNLATTFNDTDDAMRLVEVRDFMAGQGWFDLNQYRLDPPTPVAMHWSRFIDLPIALLIRVVGLFLDAVAAEKVAIALWPVLPFSALLVTVRHAATRLGGPWAGGAGVLLTGLCLAITWQFAPGRIDHHNAQMVLSLAMVAALVDGQPRAGAAAGFFAILGLAIGMEILPYLALATMFVLWRLIADPAESRHHAVAFGASITLTAPALFLATTPPAAWWTGTCDAFSANYASLAVIGGSGLVMAAGLPILYRDRRRMLCALALTGLAAIAAFAAFDPACLRGPYGQVDPRLYPVWINGITEMQPISASLADSPRSALAMLWGPLLGLAASVFLLRHGPARRRPELILLGLCLLASLAIGLMQIRTMVYAGLFALPLIAGAIGHAITLRANPTLTAPALLLGSVLALNTATMAIALSLVLPLGPLDIESAEKAAKIAGNRTGGDCKATEDFARLAAEPPGLVAAPIDLGPFILATTKHSVLAAPYHRFNDGILAAHAILTSDVEQARRTIMAAGASYIALCARPSDIAEAKTLSSDSLTAHLFAGEVPSYLTALDDVSTVRLYKVNRPQAQ